MEATREDYLVLNDRLPTSAMLTLNSVNSEFVFLFVSVVIR